MKYLDNYNNFQFGSELIGPMFPVVQEGYKDDFRHMVIATTITAFISFYPTLHKIFGKETARDIVINLKKQENQPSLVMKSKIDSLKESIIDEINNCEYKNKKALIDSINRIPIYTYDFSKVYVSEDAIGAFIPCSKTIQNSFILINNKLGDNDEEIVATLVHELYHYVIELDNIDYSNLLDKKTKDDDYLKRKISMVFYHIPFDELENNDPKHHDLYKRIRSNVSKVCDELVDKRSYYTDKYEFTVRIKQMKRWMVDKGIIDKYTDVLTEEDILKLINDDETAVQTFSYVLPFIDYSKLVGY